MGHRQHIPDDEYGHVSGVNAVSGVYRSVYHGIEATSCQAERNFSALAHLIGDLRRSMLASKVERMMFIRLNRHQPFLGIFFLVCFVAVFGVILYNIKISIAFDFFCLSFFMRLLIFIQDET